LLVPGLIAILKTSFPPGKQSKAVLQGRGFKPNFPMSIQEEARKLMIEERRHDEHIQDNMLNRAAEPLDSLTEGVSEKARELLVEARQHEEHIQETMSNRAGEEIVR
jgi:hypothetical protein